MELFMWSALASIPFGVAAWIVVSFFGKPLLDFLKLKSQVHEEIVFTGNVGAMVAARPVTIRPSICCVVLGLRCRQRAHRTR